MTAQLACLTQVLIVSPSTWYVRTTTKLGQSITARMPKTPVPCSGWSGGGKSSWRSEGQSGRSRRRKPKGV